MDLSQLGQRYRFFIQLMELLAYLPRSVAYRLAPLLAYSGLSPIHYQHSNIRTAISETDIKLPDWHRFWHKKLADHAVFCLNTFYHEHLDKHWLVQHVTLDIAQLQRIVAQSRYNNVLFLTYHHPFHHTLCSTLGLAGFRLQALAANEESSPIFSHIGKYIKHLHKGCSAQFNGGSYLFFNNERSGVKLTKQALTEPGILISLNDFAAPVQNSSHNPFFNRNATAPYGSVKLACRMGVPIVTGIMLRQGENYRIIYKQFASDQSPESIMTDYFAFLAETVTEYPSIWDGWDWFSSFPLLDQK